jgi:hypothetical protein
MIQDARSHEINVYTLSYIYDTTKLAVLLPWVVLPLEKDYEVLIMSRLSNLL